MRRPQKEFNNPAHERLRNLLDMAEDAMLERGECQSHETEDALCRLFIEQLAVTTGHLDFSLFSAVQGRFGGLKPAGSGLLECSAA